MKKRKFLDGYAPNFETLQRASKDGRLALVECRDAKTGELVPAVCAVSDAEGGEFLIVPLARMFDGNPYEVLQPPAPGGGFEGVS